MIVHVAFLLLFRKIYFLKSARTVYYKSTPLYEYSTPCFFIPILSLLCNTFRHLVT